MLPNCNDPALTFLKGQGYNVVQLPKSDLAPTHLLVRRGKRLRRLGELKSVFIPDPAAPLPGISADNKNAAIVGQRSAELDIGIGLNILGDMISALGGSTLALSIGYQNARTVQFEFTDVLENNTQITQLDQFLSGATISPFVQAVREMLNSDDVYVITSTLKSAKLNVVAKDSNNTTISVNVPVLQQAIGGDVSVTAAGTGLNLVTYEGAVPLVFGFQAVRLIFDNGKYRSMKTDCAGAVALEGLQAASSGEDGLYIADDALVGLDF